MKFLGQLGSIFREAAADWLEDRADQLGAALAFYSILSLAPLLVIAISIAALAFGEEAARGELVEQMQDMVGIEGAQAIQSLLEHAQAPGRGLLPTILGIGTLLLGATGVFGQLQSSLNTIWEVQPKPGRGIWDFARDRFLSLTMVLGTGFLLLVSLVLSAVIAALGSFVGDQWPATEALWQFGNTGVSFLVVTLLFALIFKFLPDVEVRWSDVWVGALLTALLFTFGKYLIGLYLGKSALGSAYGAAGSFVVLIVWIYYSAQILFFGAELTQVYARRYGRGMVPKSGAETKAA